MRANEPKVFLPIVLYWCDDVYRSLHPTLPAIIEGELDILLAMARKNKLSYYLSKRIIDESHRSDKLFVDAVREGEVNIAQQKQTLQFLNSALGREGIDFLVIKSYKDLPYYTFDIDIMVREPHYRQAVEILHAHGYRPTVMKRRIPLPAFLENGLSRVGGGNLVKEGSLEVDIYQDTSWTGQTCVDNEFIWREPELVDMSGVTVRIPRREADLLLSLAHVIFCHGSINLLDFLYMSHRLQQDLNLDALLYEAEKYGWSHSLRILVTRIRELHRTIYFKEAPKSVSFPYIVPFRIVTGAYFGITRYSRGGINAIPSHWFSIVLKLAMILAYRKS